MKAKPVKRAQETDEYDVVHNVWAECSVKEAEAVILNIPVAFKRLQERIIPVIISGSRDKHEECVWSWNGDVNKPTLRPSINTEFKWGEEQTLHKCHSWVNDGMIQFLADSNHEQAGKTVELLDV